MSTNRPSAEEKEAMLALNAADDYGSAQAGLMLAELNVPGDARHIRYLKTLTNVAQLLDIPYAIHVLLINRAFMEKYQSRVQVEITIIREVNLEVVSQRVHSVLRRISITSLSLTVPVPTPLSVLLGTS